MAKILLLSHIFPPAIDGGSRVVYKIGQYFQSQGYQILYLSSDCSSTDDFTKTKYLRSKKLTSDQLKIPVYHHLRQPLKFFNLFIPKKSYFHQLLQVFQKGPIFKLVPFLKATVKIIKYQPDLIVAGPLPTTTILYANFLKKITHAKLLINASFHPSDPDFHQKPLIKTLQSTDYLWSLTQSETNYFIKNFKLNPKKIILAGNGIDSNFLIKKTEKLTPTRMTGESDRLKILFIGSLSAHKGLDTLITAFSTINDLQSTKLIIAGQKTLYYPEIKKQISILPKKLQSKIKFVFSFPQSKLSRLIDNCDVLILPSKQESFGLVLIEAWSRKKPVIVNNIPSLSEITNKTQGGLIFQTNNPNDLSKKILFLYKNPKKRHQLGQNGYNYVKNNYTWVKVGNKIKEKIFS